MSVLRLTRLAVAAFLALGMSFFFAPSALAQYDEAPTASVSATTVTAGDTVTVFGSGFTPGEEVVAVLAGSAERTATAVADVDGDVEFVLDTTGLSGTVTVRLTGKTSGETASVNVVVLSAQASGVPGGSDDDDNDNDGGSNDNGDNTGVGNNGGSNDNGVGDNGVGDNGGSNNGVGSNVAQDGGNGDLAFTGSDAVTPLAIGGGVLVAAGAGVVLLARTRRSLS